MQQVLTPLTTFSALFKILNSMRTGEYSTLKLAILKISIVFPKIICEKTRPRKLLKAALLKEIFDLNMLRIRYYHLKKRSIK